MQNIHQLRQRQQRYDCKARKLLILLENCQKILVKNDIFNENIKLKKPNNNMKLMLQQEPLVIELEKKLNDNVKLMVGLQGDNTARPGSCSFCERIARKYSRRTTF